MRTALTQERTALVEIVLLRERYAVVEAREAAVKAREAAVKAREAAAVDDIIGPITGWTLLPAAFPIPEPVKAWADRLGRLITRGLASARSGEYETLLTKRPNNVRQAVGCCSGWRGA